MDTVDKSTNERIDKIRREREENFKRICHSLVAELKSVVQEQSEIETKCLIRFHNCTPHRIAIFWLDFKGRPIEYPVLARGNFIDITTSVSHLWIFKVQDSKTTNGATASQQQAIKVLAVPEETINSSRIPSFLKSSQSEQQVSRSSSNSLHEEILGSNNVVICALCKFVLINNPQIRTKVPCPHFTGEVKFSITDFEHGTWSRDISSYIYSCNEVNHCSEHSRRRRNIFLVEPFFNLRERCFLAIKNGIEGADIFEMNIPASLQREYLRFTTTLR